ncbi:alpha-xylosidase [Prolixibacteraceae bacterium Z1-6]|uniref:Alpha-xylosidase n=1 Tax=Draconibacterium aestuarii TaxID=2998507 RepID=A0A9X3F7K4_9BACT|nr:alpha-xylosidase [Prolixibacteraceae bacterium Z1-6]
MKQTNYQLIDFLDFDPELNGSERLWKVGKPTDILVDGTDVLVTLPFQCQQTAIDISPDTAIKPLSFQLRIRAYGDKILRVATAFEGESMPDSLMLELDSALQISQLSLEKNESVWLVKDDKGTIRAEFNREAYPIDFWSDLLPEPQESLEATFYPDGDKKIEISAYDQFFPARHDAFAIAYVANEKGIHRSTISFKAAANECFAGTGERFTKMDLSGRTLQMKNQDGQGVNNRRTYKNIPFYLSSKMYGVFMHTSAYGKISLADHSSRSVQLLIEEPAIDLFLFGGDSVEEILYGYRQVTGFPTQLPLWSYGTWMSRMTYFSADEVNTICKRLRDEDYPCDVIHLDTGWFRTDWLCEWKFNPERFPDPEKFIQDLRNDGYKVSLWQMPYVAAEAEQLNEAKANNYIAPLRESKKQGGSNFSALDYAGTIDFTSTKATDWYKGLLKELLEMGVVCIKTDFGEEIHMEADYQSLSPEKLNNLYALLYQKAAFEITKETTGNGIVWARAGWAGCQRYPLHWGGDAACTWDGMAGSLKGGLHLGLSGFGFWSHDVPGFHSLPNFMNSVVPDNLYVRWTQFGVFSSHLRYHGTSKREPYEYPAIAGIVRKWLKLRYALLPYILEQAKKTTLSGFPMLRAMLAHYPEDKICWHIDDQYFFGDDMLVAPVMNDENCRDIYLPEGNWVNLFTGEKNSGNQWLYDVKVPLEEMPVWVKEGAEISVYPHPVKSTDDLDFEKTETISFDEYFEGLEKSILGKLLN